MDGVMGEEVENSEERGGIIDRGIVGKGWVGKDRLHGTFKTRWKISKDIFRLNVD